MFRFCGLLLMVAVMFSPGALARAEDDLKVENTEPADQQPITPQEALGKIKVPEGFKVTLFAGEPDVRQPIAMAVDQRGRLWVAECYSYPTWKETGNDRLVIFEDKDNDGVFDTRKIFWSKGRYLSGFALGHGGVWICNAPDFQFIPDADGDDVPDGEPKTLLDGWASKGIHNVFNALNWGPDGWLYGCNGITAPSSVGKPGTPENERTPINCGVWRYHPTKHVFEVVAQGTTNPWGLDWNDHGQAFFTNCVIEHLWHLVPGGHYKRMFGQDGSEHSYGLMPACSKHLHWAGGDWTKARGRAEDDDLGGGHAHAGAMVYLGDNWPDKYRNSIFMGNIHGYRVNNNVLERNGSGYAGKRAPDFFFANDNWFRGLELKYGPDGGVYVTDWCDTGECHDYKGVHRTSGRVYKVVYGDAQARKATNLLEMEDAELVQLQLHKNDYYCRTARVILQHRAATGSLQKETCDALQAIYKDNEDVTRKLRALWCLHGCGAIDAKWLTAQLRHENEHVRGWAIRLLREYEGGLEGQVETLAKLAREDESALVRLEVASALQRLPIADRWAIVEALVSHAEDAEDDNLPLMIWYGIEPAIPGDKARAGKLLTAKIPLIRQYVSRRLAATASAAPKKD
jgi:putative membrane-bound dehydrogenase-like protein